MFETLIAIIVFPLVVGYAYGRRQTNPYTVQGKIHYNSGE